MPAATAALEDRHVLGRVLHLLSNMRYKDRRQRGPDQPVELLEFRPTLVPCVLVNKFWADEATSILWRRYPHLPAFKEMDFDRRQYYASKVRQIFLIGPSAEHPEKLDYLDNLRWPNLKSLELEMDFSKHESQFLAMLHAGLEHLELSGIQTGGAAQFTDVVLPSLFSSCPSLKSLRFGPGIIPDDDPVHASTLFTYFDSIPSIKDVDVKSAGFMAIDALFTRLSQRPNFEALQIEIEPGLSLLPQLEGPNALPAPFASLKRLSIMCYPEVALALPEHLTALEELQLDVCRIPIHQVQNADLTIMDRIMAKLLHCPHLRVLRIGIGAMAVDFPSMSMFPTLRGSSLVELAHRCPVLEDIYLFAMEPSAIDVTNVSAQDFDSFCKSLSALKKLSLKFHPSTTWQLEQTALQSLGSHCKQLEIARLKIPFQLPSLTTPPSIPQISMEGTFTPRAANEASGAASCAQNSQTTDICASGTLFPCLTHLAISRPDTLLAVVGEVFSTSSISQDDSTSEIIAPELEEELVRSWAQPILAHFPNLEILEAWGDWNGQDNESLNYFLPTEEILASTWEFLSGAEQDLWVDDEFEDYEEKNWISYEGLDDWEKASYVDSFMASDDYPSTTDFVEDAEGSITPVRTLGGHELPQDPIQNHNNAANNGPTDVLRSNGHTSDIPTENINDLRIS